MNALRLPMDIENLSKRGVNVLLTVYSLNLAFDGLQLTTMIFKETKLKGAYLIEIEPIEDERGFFARSFCRNELKAHEIDMEIVQCNISYNKRKGTLRGMHYQAAPYQEGKIVSCTRGSIYDVIIDLRDDSSTYCKWIAVGLSALRRNMLYVPKGFAHGFLTLEDNTEVFYHMSEFYAPGYGRGVRWNDPAFGIEWPDNVSVISNQDKSFPDFTP